MSAEIDSSEYISHLYDDIIKSSILGASQNQKKLLKFLITRNAEDTHQDIREYMIAIEVFKRPEDFDASTDSIVRAEMARLRKNLSLFSAQNPSYSVSIPSRSYELRITEESPEKSVSLPQLKNILAIVTITAALISAGYMWLMPKRIADHTADTIALKLLIRAGEASEIFDDSRLENLSNTLFKRTFSRSIVKPVVPTSEFDYVVVLDGGENGVTATLFNKSNSIIWTEAFENTYNYNADEFNAFLLIKLDEKLFGERSIAARLFLNDPAISAGRKEQFHCLDDLNRISKFGVKDPQILDHNHASDHDFIACAENPGSTEYDQVFADALISQFYTKQYLGDIKPLDEQALSKAKLHLDKAKAIDPLHIEYLKSALFYELVSPDGNQDKKYALDRDLGKFYGNDIEVMRFRSYVQGYYFSEWEEAKRLADSALVTHDPEDSIYRYVHSMYYLLEGDYDRSWYWFLDTGNIDLQWFAVLDSVHFCAYNNYQPQYPHLRKVLATHDINGKEDIKNVIRRHRVHPKLGRFMIDVLDKESCQL